MKHLRLFENSSNKFVYVLNVDSSFFIDELDKFRKMKVAFDSEKDLKQFVINMMNDIYESLVKLEFIKPDENDKLETYKECIEFFKDLHTGDEDFPDIFKYTFNINKIEIIKNVDSLEIHKLRKNTKKYNV